MWHRYWIRHALLAWVELPIYAASCKRYSLAAQVSAPLTLFLDMQYGCFAQRCRAAEVTFSTRRILGKSWILPSAAMFACHSLNASLPCSHMFMD